jgi:hypothetical protein
MDDMGGPSSEIPSDVDRGEGTVWSCSAWIGNKREEDATCVGSAAEDALLLMF